MLDEEEERPKDGKSNSCCDEEGNPGIGLRNGEVEAESTARVGLTSGCCRLFSSFHFVHCRNSFSKFLRSAEVPGQPPDQPNRSSST